MNGHDTNSHDDRNDHGKKRKRLAFLIARQDGNGVAALVAWAGIEWGHRLGAVTQERGRAERVWLS